MDMFDDLFTKDDFSLDDEEVQEEEEVEELELDTTDDEDYPDSDQNDDPDPPVTTQSGGVPDPSQNVPDTPGDACDDCGEYDCACVDPPDCDADPFCDCDHCDLALADDDDDDGKWDTGIKKWDTGTGQRPVPKNVWKPKTWKT